MAFQRPRKDGTSTKHYYLVEIFDEVRKAWRPRGQPYSRLSLAHEKTLLLTGKFRIIKFSVTTTRKEIKPYDKFNTIWLTHLPESYEPTIAGGEMPDLHGQGDV